MGQYYKAVIQREDGSFANYNTVNIVDKDGNNIGCYSLKLREHSWIDNDLTSSVEEQIYEKPQRVAWVGDYFKKNDVELWNDEHADKLPIELPDIQKWPVDTITYTGFSVRDKFLVNHTKKQYIDIEAYLDEVDRDGWALDPLPILTALGNGRGGGDYHKNLPDYDKVGMWAWDVISVEDNAPNDGNYDELKVKFLDA